MQRFHQALSSYILSTHLAPKILPNRCVDLHWRRQSIHNRHHSYDVLSLYSAAQSIQLQSGRQVYRCGDLIHGHRRFKHCHRRDALHSTDSDDFQSPYAKDTEGRCDCCVWDCVNVSRVSTSRHISNYHRTVVSSVIRLVYLPVVLASTDPSWDAAPANIWTYDIFLAQLLSVY